MKLTTWIVVAGLATAPLACGDSSGGERDEGDAGDTGDDDTNGFLGDDEPGGIDCEAITCEDLDTNCGPVANGCGELLECGDCDEGEACGIEERNVCTTLADLCMPQSREDACRGKECGQEGDGCGDSYDCGSCEDGQACGVFEPFRCATPSENDTANCVARIESCEEVGAECGLIGNGCGGVIDCDDELGGCGSGELCGLGGPQKCGEAPECVPLSAEVACDGKCGIVSNGCGTEVDDGLIDCSEFEESRCPEDTVCGGAGVPNQCASGGCNELSEAAACADVECGVVSDGCNGSHVCGSCDSGETCRSGVCEPICVPIPETEACAGIDCGVVGDGCGGTHQCGGCPNGQLCGAIDAFQCDPIPPSGCAALTDAEACDGKECGIAYDGCGADAANRVDCSSVNGGCSGTEVCGLTEPFHCGSPVPPDCDVATCVEMGWECGMAVDACGNVFDCADEGLVCNADTETCIGGIDGPARCLNGTEGTGTCSVCDAVPDCSAEPQRTRITGRVITPGRDNADTANQLGVPNAFVYILRNNDESELPAIASGIPRDGANYLTDCDRCEDQDLGPVLASTTTNALGEFEIIGDVPVAREFVLVVKIGKFRRAQKVSLPPAAACETTAIPPLSTRLPRSLTDGLRAHIPRVAVSTGRVDAMECVFYKMGLAESEFGAPGPTGAGPTPIHIYRGANDGGSRIAGSTGSSIDLYSSRDRIFSYDMLVFDCESQPFQHNTDDPKIREFVNRGGRMFASHYSYTWLHDNGTTTYASANASGNPFDTGLGPSAIWGNGDEDADTGYVSLGRPGAVASKIQNFADWLVNEDAASIEPNGHYAIDIIEPRDLATSVGNASEEFVYRYPDDTATNDLCRPCFLIASENNCSASPNCVWNQTSCGFKNDCTSKGQVACQADAACSWNGSCSFADDCDSGGVDANDQTECLSRAQCGWDRTSVQQFSFNTPYGAPDEAICGRVAYSGFHVVSDETGYGNTIFPQHCSGDLTSQEKVLLYMLFDLGACVSTEGLTPPECEPVEECTGRCGVIADGCGGTVDCAECPQGQVCLAGGVCSTPECQPATCANQGATCGFVGDGCGGTLDCGPCDEGQVCGLVTANQCTATCIPLDEASACDGKCGYVSDECSDVYECAECPQGLSCVDNECVDENCDPLSACPAPLECGVVSDGCDGSIDCGDCTPPAVCGGGGDPNICDVPQCTPLDCEDFDAECGWIGDGCGDAVNCGPCPPGQLCGAGGPNRCDGCQPQSCEDANAECGKIGDGCGGVVECGPCPEGQTCGAETPNQCSDGPGCRKRSCESANAECGIIGDGCGGVIDCGDCSPDEVCGFETPFQCDRPECTPTTCEAEDAECGALGDGCGGLIECGSCGPGRSCGRDAPNQCPDIAR